MHFNSSRSPRRGFFQSKHTKWSYIAIAHFILSVLHHCYTLFPLCMMYITTEHTCCCKCMWANQIHSSHWLQTVSQPRSERIGELHAAIQLQDFESSSKRAVYSLSCACKITFRVFISRSMPAFAALFSCSCCEARVSFILITAIEIE